MTLHFTMKESMSEVSFVFLSKYPSFSLQIQTPLP